MFHKAGIVPVCPGRRVTVSVMNEHRHRSVCLEKNETEKGNANESLDDRYSINWIWLGALTISLSFFFYLFVFPLCFLIRPFSWRFSAVTRRRTIASRGATFHSRFLILGRADNMPKRASDCYGGCSSTVREICFSGDWIARIKLDGDDVLISCGFFQEEWFFCVFGLEARDVTANDRAIRVLVNILSRQWDKSCTTFLNQTLRFRVFGIANPLIFHEKLTKINLPISLSR